MRLGVNLVTPARTESLCEAALYLHLLFITAKQATSSDSTANNNNNNINKARSVFAAIPLSIYNAQNSIQGNKRRVFDFTSRLKKWKEVKQNDRLCVAFFDHSIEVCTWNLYHKRTTLGFHVFNLNSPYNPGWSYSNNTYLTFPSQLPWNRNRFGPWWTCSPGMVEHTNKVVMEALLKTVNVFWGATCLSWTESSI